MNPALKLTALDIHLLLKSGVMAYPRTVSLPRVRAKRPKPPVGETERERNLRHVREYRARLKAEGLTVRGTERIYPPRQ